MPVAPLSVTSRISTPVMEVSICLFTKMNPLSQPHSSCGKHGLTPAVPVLTTWSLNPQWAVQALGLAIHSVGDTLTVPISGGSISAYVAKTTTTVAFIVQSGRTLSSTVLNNLASTGTQPSTPP